MTASATAAVVASASAEPFLKLSGLRKTYPGVVALADFSMEVRPGEVIGLVGENGAGKSTLMKILGGVIEPDRGTIEIDGVAHPSLAVAQSMAAGIAFVHQELNLFDNLDVAANIYIGREPRKYGFLQLVDDDKLHKAVQPFLDRLGATFSPATPVSRLSLAQQQIVEIAKALSLEIAPGYPRRADLEPADRRNRQAARGDRRPQGARHLGHLHLAPAARGGRGLRPRHRAARREARRARSKAPRSTTTQWSGSWSAASLRSTTCRLRRPAARRCLSITGLRTSTYPGHEIEPRPPCRRDPRTGGPRRRRADGARARAVRHRPGRRREACCSTARRCASRPPPTRSHAGDLPRTRGPQGRRPAARSSDRAEHHAPQPARLRQRRPCLA